MTPASAKEIALAQADKMWRLHMDSLCCRCGELAMLQYCICEWDLIPLKNGTMTKFIIYTCDRCHKVYGNPHENLVLAIRQGTPGTVAMLGSLIDPGTGKLFLPAR